MLNLPSSYFWIFILIIHLLYHWPSTPGRYRDCLEIAPAPASYVPHDFGYVEGEKVEKDLDTSSKLVAVLALTDMKKVSALPTYTRDGSRQRSMMSHYQSSINWNAFL
ncbi:hypothetical protein DFJ58DRAFT_811650 [Suillus subalutaceus]|uniref:uncharacterized protein n=1 Tax=Suillus subalutaceus TaxID=48586 RepID=UPI001B8824AE|nr:uncharacterized protein DFJ58DRAFT_811650 [Suillus subalutaceus]KAG1839747.1 hypothetical protein DFJ58DRAFT_811650 [Suillus subalutaceus]